MLCNVRDLRFDEGEADTVYNKKPEVSCKLKKEMHVLRGHSGPVYNVAEGGGYRCEKSCNRAANNLLLDMCKQSNGALPGLGPSKELCLKASQTLNPRQSMQFPTINAKMDQTAPLDSSDENFPALEVSSGCRDIDALSFKTRPLNPWAREYKSCITRKVLSPENVALLENVIGHYCQYNALSFNKKPLNPWAREYRSCDTRKTTSSENIGLLKNVIAHSADQRLSCQQESMHSFLEKLRKQDKSTNRTVNDPISFANINGNSNLLNILSYFPHKAPLVCSRKKLLILDINGILADIIYPAPKGYKADTKIAGRAVFTRPFCSDFLSFCLERFNVAIWSSRSRKIIDRLLNYLMGDMKHKLIFCWDISHCTASNFRTLENKHKTLVFKELKKVWESYDSDLPWEKGFFNESNTFLLDDSPYKALLNPAHSGIFPYSYEYKDIADDAIGPGGNIREYLEELAAADNVQRYIEKHPFGQSAITERSLSWQFYDQVIKEQSGVPARG